MPEPAAVTLTRDKIFPKIKKRSQDELLRRNVVCIYVHVCLLCVTRKTRAAAPNAYLAYTRIKNKQKRHRNSRREKTRRSNGPRD